MAKKQHILVVEDEQHLAVGIKYNLEAEGYRVTTAGDGPSALQLLVDDAAEIDLVILDIMLPGMSGYAVCEKLRAKDNVLPVLILSARTLSEDRTRGFDVGADQYLTKPFDLDELLSRVRNLLRMYERRAGIQNESRPAARTYSVGQAEVNFDTYEARAAERRFTLTQLEMKLLQYLVQNEGRVVPRQELLEKVWEMPATVATRAVDQFIRRLRKMFEPDPSQPRHFLTIRDVGYRFVRNGADPEPGAAEEDS